MSEVSKWAFRQGDDEDVLTLDAAVAASWRCVVLVIRSGAANWSCSLGGGGCLGGVIP